MNLKPSPLAPVGAEPPFAVPSGQIALWGIDARGTCLCHQGSDCSSPGKHPKVGASGELLPYEPGDNLGNLTGKAHGVIVVDVDVHSGDGYADLAGLPGYVEPVTRTVRTASGGAHLYFKHPGFHVGNGKLAPNVDVRGDAEGWAYVLAPGSKVPAGVHVLVDGREPAEVPPWLYLALMARGSRSREVDRPAAVPPSDATLATCVRLAQEAEPSRGNGDASKALTAIAAALRLDHRVPDETCVEILLEHFNPRCTMHDGRPWPWSPEDVERAVSRVSREPRLVLTDATKEGFKALGARMRERASGGIDLDKIAELRARAEEQGPAYEPPARTETGNARLYVELHRNEVLYVPSWDAWLVWDGARWRNDANGVHAQSLVREVIAARWELLATHAPADAASRLPWIQWASASESRRVRANTLELVKCEPGMTVEHGALDGDPWLFNVANGTLDLRTGDLLEHDPARLQTKVSAIDYDPDATCPTWERFLARVTGGDATLTSFLQRAVGYSLTGLVDEQVLFFLQGEGANGKSTFTLVVRELLGQYGMQAAPDLLLAKHGESHPAEIADLHGARFALVQEVEQGRRWNESTLKQLTGGDRIKARRMRENFWEFPPTHKLWICANHKPKVRGTDEGIWRRFKLVPFAVTIPEGERDPDLVNKLRAELPGILAWAVQGCLAWRREGLGTPQRVKDATERYRQEEDRVSAFLAERCEVTPLAHVRRADLYRAYVNWATANGEDVISARDFKERIGAKHELKRKDKDGFVWVGIMLTAGTAALN